MKYFSLAIIVCVMFVAGVSDAHKSHRKISAPVISYWASMIDANESTSTIMEVPAGRSAIDVLAFSDHYGPKSATKISCQIIDPVSGKVVLDQKNGYACVGIFNLSLPWKVNVRIKNEEDQKVVVRAHISN